MTAVRYPMRSALVLARSGLSLVPVAAAAQVVVNGGVTLGFALGNENGKRSDFNPHVEAEFGSIYGGVEAHVYNGSANTEIAPYLGYRSVLGALSYDLSYRHSFLPNAGGECCGRLGAALALPLGNRVMTTLDMGLDPESGDTEVMLGADVTAFDRVTLSGGYGVSGAENNWELAAGYALSDTTEVVGHYYDGSAIKPYVGLDLTWRFNLMGN